MCFCVFLCVHFLYFSRPLSLFLHCISIPFSSFFSHPPIEFGRHADPRPLPSSLPPSLLSFPLLHMSALLSVSFLLPSLLSRCSRLAFSHSILFHLHPFPFPFPVIVYIASPSLIPAPSTGLPPPHSRPSFPPPSPPHTRRALDLSMTLRTTILSLNRSFSNHTTHPSTLAGFPSTLATT